MTKSAKPTGLDIKRSENKFTLTWKCGDSNYDDGQAFQYNVGNGWISVGIGKKDRSKAISLNNNSYYPKTKKTLTSVQMRVKGNRAKYTKTKKQKNGKKKTVTVSPKMSDWATKSFDISKPKAPTVTQALDPNLSNVTVFSWSTSTSTTNEEYFIDTYYETKLFEETSETDGNKLDWSDATTGTGGASGSYTAREQTELLAQKSYTRWFRIRSRGIAGYSGWSYSKHVYATPIQAKIRETSFDDNGANGYLCRVRFFAEENVAYPIAKVQVQYAIATPEENLEPPSGMSWTDARTIGATGETDEVAFPIDSTIGLDQCLYVRANTQHDYDANVTYGKPQLVTGGVGYLTAPTITSVTTDDTTYQATIVATNNSSVPDSFLVIVYRPASDVTAENVVGIIPHSDTEVSVQAPDWSEEESYAFGVYAAVGDPDTITRDLALMKSRDIIWRGGEVPKAPNNVRVSATDITGTIRVLWDWSWAKATGAEISWSDHEDAWESTDAPDTYEISNIHAGRWNISGLETGMKWYVRVRLIAGSGDAKTYGPYSETQEIDLTSAPSIPKLELSSNVIPKDGSVTASWVYTTTDGTEQIYAEICEATITPNGIMYGKYFLSEDEKTTVEEEGQTVLNGKTYYTKVGDYEYEKVAEVETTDNPVENEWYEYQLPIAHTETAQHITISANDVGWETGKTYNLCVRVISASGRVSDDWSAPVSVTVAEPLEIEITSTSLVQKQIEVNPKSKSGDLVSFTTEQEEQFVKLQANIEPIQEATPWIGTDENTTPYLLRAMPDQSNDYNRESLNQIVGATVGWNQLMSSNDWRTQTVGGITFTNNGDGTYTINGTATVSTFATESKPFVNNHVYYLSGCPKGGSRSTYFLDTGANIGGSDIGNGFVGKCGFNTGSYYVRMYVMEGTTVNNLTVIPQLTDLTACFGTLIADYVYQLERSTTGSGIAWLRSYGFLTKDYYEYCQPRLESVRVSGHVMRDADDNIIGNYPLDSTLTLNGILKLSGDEIYADGDVYEPSGGVSRRYGVVDLGTLTWTKGVESRWDVGYEFYANISGMQTSTTKYITSKYESSTVVGATAVLNKYGSGVNKLAYTASDTKLYIVDSSYTDATAFKTAISGVYLVYELATPTTETADPYTQIQVCDPDGTEAFTDYGVESGDRDVAVPVGHESTYSLVCPVYGHDDVTVEMCGKNLFDQNIFLNATGWTEEDGVYHGLNTELYSEYPISFPVGMLPYNGQLTFSFDYHNANVLYRSGHLYFRYTDGTESYRELKSADWTHITFTSTQGKTVKGILIGVSNTLEIYLKNVQLELGSAETAYEPCQGQTYDTNLSQTVYGGTLDVVTGELVVDRKYAVIDDPDKWTVTTGTTDFRYTHSFSDRKTFSTSTEGFICSYFPVGNGENNVRWRGASDTTFGIVSTTMSLADVQAITESGNFSICYELATPTTTQLTPQEIDTLLGENLVYANSGDVALRYVEAYREATVLDEMPLQLTISGAGDSLEVVVAIERASAYHVDRPNERAFDGYEEETVAQKYQTGDGEMEITTDDLIGALDDTASYRIVATAKDGLGQTAKDTVGFEVSWEHQAVVPEGSVEYLTDELIAKITPTKPFGALDTDVCDIYRLSADRPELILKGVPFGVDYVDPYPAIGQFGGYRIVLKTANGDYITEDSTFAWIDLDEDWLDTEYTIIDFEAGQIPLKYNVDVSNQWEKDFTETKYLGGSVQGDWNAAVSRKATVNAVTITLTDANQIETIRRLADTPSICHIRTQDGSSFAGDIQVSTSGSHDKYGMVESLTFTVTRVDPEQPEGMTLKEWNDLHEEE